jgi:hypothetical protein
MNVVTTSGFKLVAIPSPASSGFNAALAAAAQNGTGVQALVRSMTAHVDTDIPVDTLVNLFVSGEDQLVWYPLGKRTPKGAYDVAIYTLATATVYIVDTEYDEIDIAEAVERLHDSGSIAPQFTEGTMRMVAAAGFTKLAV